ncbi:hypothetical protein JEQ12_010185 [Ovis aries]|uniref:Uncharacterized protein n=1 Tax=Ovis aries TaxID=9940 RepID=A0A836D785_SHEEP|nr:hypothetical protein JEQ12_010185 [Ovis aries]
METLKAACQNLLVSTNTRQLKTMDSEGPCFQRAFTVTAPYKVPITPVAQTPGLQGGVVRTLLSCQETEAEKILTAGGRQSQDPVKGHAESFERLSTLPGSSFPEAVSDLPVTIVITVTTTGPALFSPVNIFARDSVSTPDRGTKIWHAKQCNREKVGKKKVINLARPETRLGGLS